MCFPKSAYLDETVFSSVVSKFITAVGSLMLTGFLTHFAEDVLVV